MSSESTGDRIRFTPIAELVVALDEHGKQHVKTCGGLPDHADPTISYEYKIDIDDPPIEGFLSVNHELGQVAITLELMSELSTDADTKRFVDATYTADDLDGRNAWQLVEDIVQDQFRTEK